MEASPSGPMEAVTESQQLKRFRSGWPVVFPAGRRARRPLEVNQPSLVRVDREAVLSQPLGKPVHHAAGVVFPGKPDDEVIRIADEVRPASKSRFYLRLWRKVRRWA